MSPSPKLNPWTGAVTMMVLSQINAACIGVGIAKYWSFGGLLSIIFFTLALFMGAVGSLVSGYLALKLARASMSAIQQNQT